MISAEKKSAIGIGIAAVVGLITGLAGGDGADQLGGVSVFAVATIAAFAINIIVFIPSFAARTEHYYDLTGSFTYIGVTALALIFSSDLDARSIIAAILVLVWAGRLGTFLFRRVK
jgi:steroid 5-alpha reductase family enzyme